MKAKEILTESILLKEKAPVKLGSQVWSAVKGAFGSQQGKADADVGARATQIYQKFNQQALRTGLDMTNMPVKNLQAWFKEQGLAFPKSAVGTATALDLTDKDTSKQFWTAAAQQAFSKAGSGGQKLGQQYGVPAAKKRQPKPKIPSDFKSLQGTLAGAKANLHPNQINALIQTLTGP